MPVAESSSTANLAATAHASLAVAARTQRVVKNPRRLVFWVVTSRRKTGPPRTITLNLAIVGRDNATALTCERAPKATDRQVQRLVGQPPGAEGCRSSRATKILSVRSIESMSTLTLRMPFLAKSVQPEIFPALLIDPPHVVMV